MASVGDVIRVRGCQVLLGETLCNVFYYLVAVWTGNVDLDDFLDDFTAGVIDSIALTQTTDIEWVDLYADNLNDADEFVERPISINGVTEANVMPAYVAVGVQLVRTTKQTRHGAKRFAGMGESEWTDGVFSMSQARQDNLEDACEYAIDVHPGGGDFLEAHPVIVGTDPITGQPDPTRTNTVKSAKVRRGTTQNSRKDYTQ